MVTAGATANTTEGNSRASRESGLLYSHSHGESIDTHTYTHTHTPYMLNTRAEEYYTVFYSYVACFMNTSTLNVYISMPYAGLTRRNTVFVFVWLSPRNTWIPVQQGCWTNGASRASYSMNEARLSHLLFWGPSDAVFFLIKRPSG